MPSLSSHHREVDAGRHEAFLQQPGLLWGSAILSHPQTRWASLYRRNKTFDTWAHSQPQPPAQAAASSQAAASPSQAASVSQQWQPQAVPQLQPPSPQQPPPSFAPPPSVQQPPPAPQPLPPQQWQQQWQQPQPPPPQHQPWQQQNAPAPQQQWQPPQPAPPQHAFQPQPPLAAAPRHHCKFGCGRGIAPGLTRSGNPFDTCCRGCAMGRGHGRHDEACERRYLAALAQPL